MAARINKERLAHQARKLYNMQLLKEPKLPFIKGRETDWPPL